MNNKNSIKDEKLDDVSGGGLFSQYSDEEYVRSGVKVIGSGVLWNDSYQFNGQTVSTDDANLLVEFYRCFGRKANSLAEALRWFESDDYDGPAGGMSGH